MEIKKLATKLLKETCSVDEIEKALLYIFCLKTNCNFSKSQFISNYFTEIDYILVDKIEFLLKDHVFLYDIYNLIELFELLIPSCEGKENGMVYTPTTIKNFILKSTITSDSVPIICDPSCGCGSFLISAAEYIHKKYHLCYGDIFTNHIFGIDIIAHNIFKCKILFHLMALINGEQIKTSFNLAAGNSLEINWSKTFPNMPTEGFDYVVGNPPYVRSKNLSDAVKDSLCSWETTKSGTVDLYIPFYELGIKILSSNGKLGYISPNTFLQSVNGRNLRDFLNSLY